MKISVGDVVEFKENGKIYRADVFEVDGDKLRLFVFATFGEKETVFTHLLRDVREVIVSKDELEDLKVFVDCQYLYDNLWDRGSLKIGDKVRSKKGHLGIVTEVCKLYKEIDNHGNFVDDEENSYYPDITFRRLPKLSKVLKEKNKNSDGVLNIEYEDVENGVSVNKNYKEYGYRYRITYLEDVYTDYGDRVVGCLGSEDEFTKVF